MIYLLCMVSEKSSFHHFQMIIILIESWLNYWVLINLKYDIFVNREQKGFNSNE